MNLKLLLLSAMVQLVYPKVIMDGFNVRESGSFSYTVALLRKYSFLTAGALITDSWVLSDGNELFTLHGLSRQLKVRVGSTNYKKGGALIAVKHFAIHPKFNDTGPEYDLALTRMADKVGSTSYVKPIKMLYRRENVATTHFIVTYWSVASYASQSVEFPRQAPVDTQRTLQSTHLHPEDSANCKRHLNNVNATKPANLMCLDPAMIGDPCMRGTWRGAPVVLNRVLWGITSTWMPANCEEETSIFVNLVSSGDVSLWIHETLGYIEADSGSREDNAFL